MTVPRWLWLVPLLTVLIAGAPLYAMLLADGIAAALGCKTWQPKANSCPFAGTDLTTLLNNMSLFGLLLFVTIPIGSVVLFGWLIAAIQHWLLGRKQQPSV